MTRRVQTVGQKGFLVDLIECLYLNHLIILFKERKAATTLNILMTLCKSKNEIIMHRSAVNEEIQYSK